MESMIRKNNIVELNQEGLNKYIIDLTDLPSGLYLVELQFDKLRVSKKISKL